MNRNKLIRLLFNLFLLVILSGWALRIAVRYYYHLYHPGCIPVTIYHFTVFGTVVLLGYGLGKKLLDLLKIDFSLPAEEIIFSFGLGLGLLAYFIFFIGLLGGLYFWLISVLILVLLLWLSPEIGGLFVKLKQFWHNSQHIHLSIFEKYVCGIISVYVLVNIFCALVPCGYIYGDIYTYHLAAPKIYLRNHQIVNIPFIKVALMPFTVEMLYLLGLLFKSEIAC